MMFLWACAGVPLGAYNISSNFNIALQIQPQILTVLSLITWGQCFHYADVSVSLLAPCPLLEVRMVCKRTELNPKRNGEHGNAPSLS